MIYRNILHKCIEVFLKRLYFLTNHKGQALIEFILLLVVMFSIVTLIYAVSMNNITTLWEYFLNLVVDDTTQKIKL